MEIDEHLLVLVLGYTIAILLAIIVWMYVRIRELRGLANFDPLTGLLNKRAYYKALSRLVDQLPKAQEEHRNGTSNKQTSLTIMMVDGDRFKMINDTHGHIVGDSVLKGIADALSSSVRKTTDIVGRFGGEEFIIALPNISAGSAKEKAEEIRGKIEALRLTNKGISMTASIGMVRVNNWEASIESLISLADGALYTAKNEGRNRVVCQELSITNS